MGVLAFFPWLSAREPLETLAFRLLPFEPNKSPCDQGSTEQNQVDRVLQAYYGTSAAPLGSATVLELPNHNPIDELEDEEIAESFLLSELIAVSALSTREFFRHDYFNRDNYRLVVQRFQPNRHTVAIETRRRDGSSMNAWIEGSLRIIRPPHIPVHRGWELDMELLDALLAARGTQHWDRVYDAVRHYNRANTDAADIAMTDEAVMLVAAFQRVLDCSSARVDELTKKLLARASPSEPMPAASCTKRSTDPNVTARLASSACVIQGWIEDFYALRGSIAHGRPDTSYPSVWSLREHLLLGSFLFPLVLKRELMALGHTLNATPVQVDIDTFEELACEDHFREFEPGDDYPWSKIRSPIRLAVRRTLAQPGNHPEAQ